MLRINRTEITGPAAVLFLVYRNGLAETLDREITKIINDGAKSIELDLSELDFVDSAGIGIIVKVKKTIDYLRLKFKIINIEKPQVLEVFKTTGLDKINKAKK